MIEWKKKERIPMNRRRKKKIRRLIGACGLIVSLTAGVTFGVLYIVGAFDNPTRVLGMENNNPVVASSTQQPTAEPIMELKASATKPTKKPVTTPKVTKAPKVTTKPSKSTKEPVVSKDTNFTTVKESYFDDAIFIGDSRTQGFALYAGLKNATYYTDKGLMVDTIFTEKPVKINGKKMTIIDALKKTSFKKVYIMLGVNELGWYYESVFIDKYKEIIQEIKKAQPEAIVYVQSIIHVTKEKSANNKVYTNKKINERNELLKKMAEEEGAYYLDINEATDSKGVLPTDATTDGVHLNQKYCKKWKTYLMEHAISDK